VALRGGAHCQRQCRWELLTPGVYSTSGQYDLLMKCYLDEKTDIGHFVTSKIQTLAGVKDTFTLITFKAFS
jgi:DNA-binding Lrp family transcriptional regulator